MGFPSPRTRRKAPLVDELDEKMSQQSQAPHNSNLPDSDSRLPIFIGLCCLLLLIPLFAIAVPWLFIGIFGWRLTPSISGGEFIIGSLTLCYVIVSTGQWVAVRRMLRMTRESNTLTLRAWVVLDGIGNFSLVPDLVSELEFTVRNVGKLPAIDGKAGSAKHFVKAPTQWPMPPDNIDQSHEFMVSAGLTQRLVFTVLPLSKAEVAAIKARTHILAMTVTVVYTDPLGTKGETRICAIFDLTEQRFVGAPKGNTVE